MVLGGFWRVIGGLGGFLKVLGGLGVVLGWFKNGLEVFWKVLGGPQTPPFLLIFRIPLLRVVNLSVPADVW